MDLLNPNMLEGIDHRFPQAVPIAQIAQNANGRVHGEENCAMHDILELPKAQNILSTITHLQMRHRRTC
jgi:hypothetical protein